MITVKKIEILGSIITVVLTVVLWIFWGWKMGISALFGGLISLSSFYLSYLILRRMLTRMKKKSIGKIVLFVVLKIGFLFVIVPYAILKMGVDPVGFIVGFSAIIISITVLAISKIREVKNAP